MSFDFIDGDELLNEGIFVNFRTKQAIKNNEYYVRLKQNCKRIKDKNYSVDERIEFCDQIDSDVTELMRMCNKYMVEDSAVKKIRQGVTTDLIPEPEIIGIHGLKDAYKQSIASDRNFTVREKFINKLKKIRTEAFLTKSKLLKQRRVIVNECTDDYNTICEMDNLIENFEIMTETVLTEGIMDRFTDSKGLKAFKKDVNNFISVIKSTIAPKYNDSTQFAYKLPQFSNNEHLNKTSYLHLVRLIPKKGADKKSFETAHTNILSACNKLSKNYSEIKCIIGGSKKDEGYDIFAQWKNWKKKPEPKTKTEAAEIRVADAYTTLFEAAKDMVDTIGDTNDKLTNGNNVFKVTFTGIDLKEADKKLVALNQMLINQEYEKIKIPMTKYNKGDKLNLAMFNRVQKGAEKIIKNGEGLLTKGRMNKDIRSVIKQATKILHETQNLSKKCIG